MSGGAILRRHDPGLRILVELEQRSSQAERRFSSRQRFFISDESDRVLSIELRVPLAEMACTHGDMRHPLGRASYQLLPTMARAPGTSARPD